MLVLGLILAGCTPTGGPAAHPSPSVTAPGTAEAATCPDATAPITASIVFGTDNSLWSIDAAGGTPQLLFATPEHSYVYQPAWSPDGKTLAFTFARLTLEGTLSWLPIGVICGLDRDTGEGRLLARGTEPSDSLTEASWTPDGQALLLTMHQPRLDAEQHYIGNTMTVARYELQTNQLETLVPDAMSPELSPDGNQLVFVQAPSEEPWNTQIFLAQPDGTSPTALPTHDTSLRLIRTPRWSPDGAHLVFAASDGNPAQRLPSQHASLWDMILGVRIAQAHGEPTALWIATVDDSQIQRLTPTTLDDPSVAWSSDGRQLVYTHGVGGVFLIDFPSGREQQISERGNYGGITWAPE